MADEEIEAPSGGRPETAEALRRLRAWLAARPAEEVVIPSRLAGELRGVEPGDLAAALLLLAREGRLRLAYRVIMPGGEFAPGEFWDPRRVPDTIAGPGGAPLDTAGLDVTPVFYPTGAAAAAAP